MDKLANPLSHLARRAHLIALALFAAVALAVFEDYGYFRDDETQRQIGIAALDYMLGDEDALFQDYHRYYGVAFEIPLVIAERVLRLDDRRAIHLSRHLLTHAFFLIAGFFAWLLAYRLFGSRLVALFAMLIFLLHPRLYAHSFLNTKDLPFLSMFIIALYLIHRAFRRDSLWAFAICGIAVGLLANIRVMGVMLLPAVLGMLALDAFHAMRRGGGGVKHALANAAAFLAASAAALYAAWPILWRDPTELLAALRVMSRHGSHLPTLFRGETVQFPNIPWDYIPTWILITSPPAALILAALGIAAVARLCAADRRAAFANATARFGLLMVACLILPIAGVIALNSNLYDGWRQMYFLWAPICVLSAFGLRFITDAAKTPPLRAAACALAALGIAAAAVQMVRLHPLQNAYFNPLVGKSDLADRYSIDYLAASHKEALEALLKIQPSGPIFAASANLYRIYANAWLLPSDDRARIVHVQSFPHYRVIAGDGGDAAIWKREVYGAPIASVLDVRAESEAAFRAEFAADRASPPNATGGGFDVYADGKTLTYLNPRCAQRDIAGRFLLSVFPANPSRLPQSAQDAGLKHEPLNFDFRRYGMALDGKCVIVRDLPNYRISHVEIGKFALPESVREEGEEGGEWSARIIFPAYYDRFRDALASAAPRAANGPAAFAVYADGDSLIYIKEACAQEDARGRFFLSIFPKDPADLPPNRRAAGFDHDSLNFNFPEHGAVLDGDCVIIRDLPDYPISRMETGQWIPGEGELWKAKIAAGE